MSKVKKKCRCTATLNDMGECPYRCPPVVKHIVRKQKADRAACQ